jgi:anti-sigma regulatory factor (Ser/Thr protein kinase)
VRSGPLGWLIIASGRRRQGCRAPGRRPRSAATVRASARATLQRWGITEHGDDIVLVLSELLANALLHARPGPGR